MTDVVTNKPLQLLVGSGGGRGVSVPLTQLEQVRALFDQNGVAYWVSDIAVGRDGKDFVTIVSVSQNEDVNRVQALLDSIS